MSEVDEEIVAPLRLIEIRLEPGVVPDDLACMSEGAAILLHAKQIAEHDIEWSPWPFRWISSVSAQGTVYVRLLGEEPVPAGVGLPKAVARYR